MKGYILLHKQILDWEWYGDANTSRLFLHCLLKANYTDKKWRGKLVKRGQFITSNKHLSIELNLSVQQIRTALDKLITTNSINTTATNRFSLITIIKYDEYQSFGHNNNKPLNKQDNTQITNQQQTNNNQITTTKEKKEEKKNNNKKEERDAHILLKQDLIFWDYFETNYKSQIDDFEKMIHKFNLKMRQENFPLEKEKLKARFESWVISWLENQSKYRKSKSKFKPHR